MERTSEPRSDPESNQYELDDPAAESGHLKEGIEVRSRHNSTDLRVRGVEVRYTIRTRNGSISHRDKGSRLPIV